MNRHLRRAATKRFQKFSKTHSCVLAKDAKAVGITLKFDDPAAYHKFHTVRGEPVCFHCGVCELFQMAGRAPTVFSDEEKEVLLNAWAETLSTHAMVKKQYPFMVPFFDFVGRLAA